MPGQHNVVAQLPADAVPLVFVRFRERRAGFHIPLKPAVVYADRHVHILPPQRFERLPGGGKGVRYRNARQILRLFPDFHEMGRDAGKPHAKPVRQRHDGSFLHAADALDVRTQAPGVQVRNKGLDGGFSVVKVVVAERYEIVSRKVQYFRGDRRALFRVLEEPVRKGTSLQRVAAVDAERVLPLGKKRGAAGKPRGGALPRCVVDVGEIAVDVARKGDRKIAVHIVCSLKRLLCSHTGVLP